QRVEVLIVDDGSPDGTGLLVDELVGKREAQGQRDLHVLHRSGKQGLGKAYVAGFEWGLSRNYSCLVQMDADFSHRPAGLMRLLDMAEKSDFVVGSRWVPGGGTRNWNWRRKLLSRCGSAFARWRLGFPISDWTGGFNLWQRRVLE